MAASTKSTSDLRPRCRRAFRPESRLKPLLHLRCPGFKNPNRGQGFALNKLKKRLIDELIGGGKRPSDDQETGEGTAQEQPQEEQDPEDELENALKKLFDR